MTPPPPLGRDALVGHLPFIARAGKGEGSIALTGYLVLGIVESFTWHERRRPSRTSVQRRVDEARRRLATLGRLSVEMNHLVGILRCAEICRGERNERSLLPALLAYANWLMEEEHAEAAADVAGTAAELRRVVASDRAYARIVQARALAESRDLYQADLVLEDGARWAEYSRDTRMRIEVALAQAHRSTAFGDPSDALEVLNGLPKSAKRLRDPRLSARVYSALGSARAQLAGAVGEAVDNFAEALEVWPRVEGNEVALRGAASLLRMAGAFDEARETLAPILDRTAPTVDLIRAISEEMQISCDVGDELGYRRTYARLERLRDEAGPSARRECEVALRTPRLARRGGARNEYPVRGIVPHIPRFMAALRGIEGP